MKANIPQPVHESYLKYRRERFWKIFVPVGVSVALCLLSVVLVTLATFQGDANVSLWAQISEIWLAIPTIIILLIVFALVAGMVFLMGRFLQILPIYTGRAQDFTHRVKSAIRRGADSAAKPVIFIDSIGASINRIFRRR